MHLPTHNPAATILLFPLFSLQNMLCGMCGTYNHQSQDDFTLQDASLTDDAIAFGDNWMMGECPFTSTAEHVCPPEIEAQAEAKCDVLR